MYKIKSLKFKIIKQVYKSYIFKTTILSINTFI